MSLYIKDKYTMEDFMKERWWFFLIWVLCGVGGYLMGAGII